MTSKTTTISDWLVAISFYAAVVWLVQCLHPTPDSAKENDDAG